MLNQEVIEMVWKEPSIAHLLSEIKNAYNIDLFIRCNKGNFDLVERMIVTNDIKTFANLKDLKQYLLDLITTEDVLQNDN